eukprot:463760_1
MSTVSAISNCNAEETSWVIIVVAFGSVFLLSCIVISYRFIKFSNRNTLILKYMQPVYLILVCLTFVVINITNICICTCNNDIYTSQFLALLSSLLISLEAYGLQLLFFTRIYHCFQETCFAISTTTLIYFSIIYIITPICYVFICIIYINNSVDPTLEIIINGIVAIISFTMMLSILILFVYKLIKVLKQKNSNENDQQFYRQIIKKTTILISTTIFFKVLLPFFIVLRSRMNSVSVFYFAKLFAYFLVYADFAALVLSNSQFNNYYVKICGAMEMCCSNLWTRCIHPKTVAAHKTNQKMMHLEVSDKTSKTSTALPTIIVPSITNNPSLATATSMGVSNINIQMNIPVQSVTSSVNYK